jgi:hypothetical protein
MQSLPPHRFLITALNKTLVAVGKGQSRSMMLVAKA